MAPKFGPEKEVYISYITLGEIIRDANPNGAKDLTYEPYDGPWEVVAWRNPESKGYAVRLKSDPKIRYETINECDLYPSKEARSNCISQVGLGPTQKK